MANRNSNRSANNRMSNTATQQSEKPASSRPALNLAVIFPPTSEGKKPEFFRCGALWPQKDGKKGYVGILRDTLAGIKRRLVVTVLDNGDAGPHLAISAERINSRGEMELVDVGAAWKRKESEGYSGYLSAAFSDTRASISLMPPKEGDDA
jgi:uncharacterized protein (DUF736 family)